MNGQDTTILMTADTVGGVWTYAMDLARALAPHGVQVALATMGNPLSLDQRRAAKALSNVTVFESTFKLEWMADPWQDIERAGEWLLDLAVRIEPDVVHLNGYVHAALPWRAPVLVVGHSCVLSWWRAVKDEDAPAEWERYRAAVTRGLRSADMVAAPSRAMLSALERHYAPLPPARVILNGRDGARYRPAEKHAFVLTAGRVWDEAKNVSALEAVAGDLAWPVLVAGDAGGNGGAGDAADGAGSANITPLGHLDTDALAGYLGHASIYALPARYEPFGLSVLEAALCGCALLLGDIDSLRELWSGAAAFVPPDDPRALGRELARLIDDAALRQSLGQRARERAARYTPERMVEGYLAAYRDLTLPQRPAHQPAAEAAHRAVLQP